jgi:formiminotetrahydrofolate cyclodeaminase
MKLVEMTLEEFTYDLASGSPAPGGGAAAALSGALGASLIAMVCHLTLGRKNYEHLQAHFETMLVRAEALRVELLDAIQRDADAYTSVMTAYQLPKESEEEKALRTEAVQAALKHAAEIPLQVAVACGDVLQMGEKAAQGNKNAVSDAGAGALLAESGLRAALLNVEINLGLITDDAFRAQMREQLEPLKRLGAIRQSVLDTVQSRI